MKLRFVFALGLSIAALLSCEGIRRQSTASGRSSVQIDEHSILIPGTAISGEDREALNKIFSKYDSSLYRIAVYEKGSLKKQIGKMDEMEIGAIATEYSRNATASGLSNWTTKIGSTTHVTTHGNSMPGNTTHVTTAGSTTHVTTTGAPTHVTTPGITTHITRITEESDALVKEVTPILEKYSK